MRLFTKLVIGIAGIAFLASGATGSYFYFQAKNALYKSLRQELIAAASIAAKLVDGDKLQHLKSPEQSKSKSYKQIQSLMGKIAQSNSEFLYAYTMRLENGKVKFIVDSPPSDDDGDGQIGPNEMPAPIGEEYKNPPDSLLNGFVEPSADSKPWHDKWGWTISGYAPIYNSQGQSVALLGIDMSADRIGQKLFLIQQAGIISLGISLILALGLTFYFSRQVLQPLKKLEGGLHRVIQGDYNVRLDYKIRDELGKVIDYFNKMVSEIREKELLKSSFGKIVDKDIMQHLLKKKLQLGGEVIEVSILFCDLRGFTRLSTKLPPSLLVSLLNEYFTSMVQIVEKYDGVVDKFIGDSLMAVFGHPKQLDNANDQALSASIEMLKECEAMNERLHLDSDFTLINSIGLHKGHVLAGNIGSPERMEYTFIGDTVNVASRLEEKTRQLGTRLAMSGSFYEQLTNQKENLFSVGDQTLSGREEALLVYILRNEGLGGSQSLAKV